MKVALAFFGQPRFVDNQNVIETYKNVILDRYDTDVFCHMWWQKTGGEYDYSSWSKINKCPIPENAPQIVEQNYNPITIDIEESKTFELPPNAKKFVDENFTGKHPDGNHWNHKNYSNVMSQLYSIKKVATILSTYAKEKDVKYDWIVLARYDTVLINFPNLETCNPGKFYLPGHHPRFPDTIHAFGPKFLGWAKNAFDDVDFVYEGIWEPSPEAFKMGSFLRRYSHSDLFPYPMDAHCIRS